MVSIKNPREIELLKIAGEITGSTHNYLKPYIKPGITTKQLDTLAEEYIRSRGATPSFNGYEGFPATICASINEEVVHGIPGNRKLKEGDIITLDIGACFKGYHGDSAWTYAVGKISKEKQKLMDVTKESLFKGLEQIKPGKKLGDIGHAIQTYAESFGYGVVRELVGHGVGTSVHEEPDVPNYGKPNTGLTLKEGMVIAVEPMITMGNKEICILEDDWTIITEDEKPAAHFEHTIVVTKDGYEILTRR